MRDLFKTVARKHFAMLRRTIQFLARLWIMRCVPKGGARHLLLKPDETIGPRDWNGGSGYPNRGASEEEVRGVELTRLSM
jgi:hypothetical protein